MSTDKIGPQHLRRKAILYVRQSSAHQVLHNRESSALQYAMRDRLTALGFTEIEVIDEDLGRSAAGSVQRSGFERMVAEVCLGKVGAVCAREVSRFARNSRDWQQLIEMCRVVDTVLVDQETIYAPRHGNDRLLLGLKGSLNEYDLIFYASARSPHAMKKPVAVNSSYLRRSASLVIAMKRIQIDACKQQSRWSSIRSRNSEALDRHCSGSTSRASNCRRSRAMATRFGGDRATPLSTGWSRTQYTAAHMRMVKRPRRWDISKRAQA
jgi:hypothetical protein